MKLTQLAAKPQLIKFVLDDNDVIAEFGEPVEYWSWDRQPLETFMKLANSQGSDTAGMIDIVKTLILDEEGRPIISTDTMLPSHVLIKVIAQIVERLGK
jgi:hypothetical protein